MQALPTRSPAPHPVFDAVQITDLAGAVYVRKLGELIAQARRDDQTGQWTVKIAPGTADCQTWCVPTKRAAYSILVDPEIVPILR